MPRAPAIHHNAGMIDTVDETTTRVEFPLAHGPIEPVPPHLADALAPATWIVQEWRDYWLSHHPGHQVTVGNVPQAQSPTGSGYTLIRLENQLGLATIRVRDQAGIEIDHHHVEVIAGKFGSIEESVDFLKATVRDLFHHVASIPFDIAKPTERLVRESQVPPTLLFVYHFFRTEATHLVRAVQAILGRPHQRLDTEPVLVRPHEVRHVDHETIVQILRAGHPMGDAPAGTTMSPLHRLRPERVWQRIPAETFDTPENRFVLHVCRSLSRSVKHLAAQGWYADVPAETRSRMHAASAALAMLAQDDRFASLGPMVVTPAQSRVLQRRDGYRELNVLWQRFQRSREPLFERMQAAIDLRSIDQLYELWVLFELIAQISAITGETPVLTPNVDTFGIPTGGYTATYAGYGEVVYNQNRTAYSTIRLRPDYLWRPVAGEWVALDAKFRLNRPAMLLDEVLDDPENSPAKQVALAKDDDLTKMHAYRDAIPQVRAAVVLFPGSVTVFWDVSRGRRELSLQDVIEGDWHGVGAIALAPHASPS